MSKTISIPTPAGNSISIGNDGELVLIAGPCAIESYDHCMKMADLIGKVCDKYNTRWIFKACYDKDCRSSPNSFHGLGLEEGLAVLDRVRTETGLPVTSISLTRHGARQQAKSVISCRCRHIFAARPQSCGRPATGKPVHLKKAVHESLEHENSCRSLNHSAVIRCCSPTGVHFLATTC